MLCLDVIPGDDAGAEEGTWFNGLGDRDAIDFGSREWDDG